MALSTSEWEHWIRDYFQVPETRVYILGCFASHVTIYSQQVRALNLITGLSQTGVLQSGSVVGVVGGGAAGLMAAAAAAHVGAQVVLVEQLPKPMALQRNSRQRFVHPHLYDWPNPEHRSSQAKLPFFPWSADYAANVVDQIEENWTALQRLHGNSILSRWNVDDVAITEIKSKKPRITWHEPDGGDQRDCDLVIIAIGFGLESEDPLRGRNYWSDDHLDSYFRKQDRRILVSGVGDGGLSDVMRACLIDFRLDKVWDSIRDVEGIEELGRELLDLHQDLNRTDQEIDKGFRRLVGGLGGTEASGPAVHQRLLRRLERQARPNRKVYIASKTGLLYGPRSSILNRLIVSQLERLSPGIHLIPFATKKVLYRTGAQLEVLFDGRPREIVDDYIERHGPIATRSIVRASWPDDIRMRGAALTAFPELDSHCRELAAAWARLSKFEDRTAVPHWRPGEFEQPAVRIGVEFTNEVSARRVRVIKDVVEDGACLLYYVVEGLSSLQSVKGIRFSYVTPAGSLGNPVPDQAGRNLGMVWEPDVPQLAPSSSPGEQREWIRRVSGVFRFDPPLAANAPPVSFGFTLSVLNGHARTQWEYDQIYGAEGRRSVSDQKLIAAEIFERSVWFSVESLEIELRLPSDVKTEPTVRVATCTMNLEPLSGEGIVNLDQVHVDASSWQSPYQSPPNLRVERTGPSTWLLQVADPPSGTNYSLEWALPSFDVKDAIEESIQLGRERLLQHARQRWNGLRGDRDIQQAFEKLLRDLQSKYPLLDRDKLDVTLMAYSDQRHKLVVAEAFDAPYFRSQIPVPEVFALPYGLGIAGACFKDGDRARLYIPPTAVEQRPQLYRRATSSRHHQVLLAIPLQSGNNLEFLLAPLGERSRNCLGVLTIGTRTRNSRLREIADSKEFLDWIFEECRQFVGTALA